MAAAILTVPSIIKRGYVVGTNEDVIEFMAEKRQREREEKTIYGSTVVRLDFYIGSPSQYRQITAQLRQLATEMETCHAIGRSADMDERDVIGMVRDRFVQTRQKLAEMDPNKTIRRHNVPRDQYRKKQ